MIPQTGDIEFTLETQTSNTYKINTDKENIKGYTDNIEAVKQAIYHILDTERYNYLIYSHNYGAELTDLVGQPINYCKSEIKRRISEALLQDDRITEVDNFVFDEPKKRVLHTTFDVTTIFGEVEITKEVNV